MVLRRTMLDWPLLRQLNGDHPLARGVGSKSPNTGATANRTVTADCVVKSTCPCCAVGCGHNAYVKDEKVVQIEGGLDSPVSRGRLCPKGSASMQLATNPGRVSTVRYRAPHAADWQDLELDVAMDMIADRVLAARKKGWAEEVDDHPVRRTHGLASLGGATLDNEENHLRTELSTALGAVEVENQARM